MKILKTIIPLVVAFTTTLNASAGILGFDGEDATSVGIYIKDIRNGKVYTDYNSLIALTPASVTKAVTTATALSKLGTDFKFTTTVSLSGQRASANEGRWNGNIIIDSSADPTLGSEEFADKLGFTDSIVARIKRMGITDISGAILINETLKDAGAVPQWECEDIAWPYGAGLYGFNYNSNCVKAYPNRGITVPASGLKITCIPTTSGTDQMRGIYSNHLMVWTSAANMRKRTWSINTTLDNPADMYIRLLSAKLNEAGIKIGKKLSEATTPSTTVYKHFSPTSAQICDDLMKRSDNLFAEGMLRAIAPTASRDECLKIERAFLDSLGLNSRYTLIMDGSGLTRATKISPRFLGDMLERMAASDVASTYISTFPIAGIDGTLKSFLGRTALKGRVALKTGSVRAVQTYAGYKLDAQGQPTHVVVVMVNGFFCPRADVRAQIEKFLLKTFENQ